MSLSHDAPSRLARLMFTLVMTLAFAGAPQWSATRAVAADVAQPPSFATVADRFDKLMAAVADEDEKLPHDTFDLNAVLKTTGNDSTAIFHWVRDHTNWIPYRGELRGSIGVLMDRMGNSLDRSILLAELLRKAGFTVRLAHTRLDPRLAEATLARIRTAPPAGSDYAAAVFPPPGLDDLLAGYSRKLATPVAELRGTVDSFQSQNQRLNERCLSRTADQVQTLTDLLKPDHATATQPADESAVILSSHFWVQQQRDKDQWIDLDPMLVDAEPGHPVATAREAIPVAADGKPIALPDELQQIVTVRVFIEQITGSKRQIKPLVSAVIHPASVIDQRIYFANVPMQWPHDNSIFTSDKPVDTIKKLVVSQREFLPTIHVGDASIHAGSFDVHGNVNDNPDFTGLGVVGESTVAAGKGTLDVFGKFNKTAPKATAQPTGTLIGQWIEYEIQIPGQAAQKFRRDVFIQEGFRPGDHAVSEPVLSAEQQLQRGLALLSSAEILAAPCQLSDAFVSHMMASHLLADKDVKMGLLRDPDLQHRKTLADDLSKLPTTPGDLYQWATLRCHLNRFAKEVCIKSPTLVSYLSIPAVKPSGELAMNAGFDLIDVPVAVRPGSKADAAHVALEQGVLDTNLESLVVSGHGHPPNTSEMMAVSDAQGVDWIAVSDAKDAHLAASGLSPEAHARILQDLADGNLVVIPTKPVQLDGKIASGWWRVNPRTGQTLGMMEDGRGAAIPGYAFVLAAVLGLLVGGFTYAGCMGDSTSNAKVVGCLGCAVLLGVLAAVGVLAVFDAPEIPIGLALALLGGGGAPLCYYVGKMP